MGDSSESHTEDLRERCSRGDIALARAFSILGKRWTGLVVGSLTVGPVGFRELSRAIGGVSDSVLSDRLAELCEQGMVERLVNPGPPVTVSYSLTEAGEGLIPALTLIAEWADKFMPEPPTAC
ncbi:HxlR family transcriptional regulator [Asanoa ferruginea]|uniref:HxlR family transcriptional regulator n=1 Tax=Asanoa ferruginea TaxID=53367 RepID=A0A3D9ZY51_9ACTN|nr:helix-turn-helix domain-containing protein [Asanoa ferruginea]REG01920.1 HxlR family transcriptional regulator [Asanoa ferruginea]GIF49970.1 transcriptional regulator [Asanoa ferruginea]